MQNFIEGNSSFITVHIASVFSNSVPLVPYQSTIMPQKSGFNLPSLKFSYLLLGMVKPTKAKARKCNVIGYGLFAPHAQSVLPIKSGMNWALEKNVMVIGHGQYTFFRSIRRFCFQQHIQYWTSSQVGAKRGAFRAVSLQGSLGVKLMAFWRRVHWVVWVLYAST